MSSIKCDAIFETPFFIRRRYNVAMSVLRFSSISASAITESVKLHFPLREEQNEIETTHGSANNQN